MDLSGRVLPVDRVLTGYNALLAAVWGSLATAVPYAAGIGAAHAAAAALPALLARARRLAPPLAVLRELYPLLWLLGFWTELGLLRPLLHRSTYDAGIAALDLACFGTHLNVVWIARMPGRWLSEPMHFFYFAYYALIFAPAIVLVAAGRRDALRDFTFRLIVAYLGCYVLYLGFPVDGPRHTLAPYVGPLTQGFFYRLTHGALHLGDSTGTAFPSSHVAGAATIAVVAWRWFPRGVAAVITLEAAGVLVSTVYTQNHYPVDAAAGLLWSLVLQFAGVPWLLRRWTRPGRARRCARAFTPAAVAAGLEQGGP
jgi:membrane-associated phospholipid phosphatase